MENQEIILEKLEKMYFGAKAGLDFSNSFELLIATILSAQTTDVQVNKVTKGLFKKYPRPEDFSKLKAEELEEEIKSIGLYRNKAKNIIKTSQMLLEDFQGQVPDNRKDLMKLAGVGRKTANVVLSNAFDIPALAVDTHVQRVSNRLGLVESDKPLDTEKQLMDIIPEEKWSDAHHWLIWHGRKLCKARKPLCEECDLKKECLFAKDN